MPHLDRPGARLWYEECGAGPVVVTTHGVTENSTYWSLTGVTDALARRHRVVSMDLRGHGRSEVVGDDPGFDVDMVAADIVALADHVGAGRFHLLSHATGGMAALRFAMGNHDRLLSLMATDTGSATLPTDDAARIDDPEVTYPRLPGLLDDTRQFFEQATWDEILAVERMAPAPFFHWLDRNHDPARCWSIVEQIQRGGDPALVGRFFGSFYDDPDPRVARLRGIGCPTLVLVGEHDTMFVAPSEQLARVIPDATLVVLDDVGHMTAVEDPDRTISTLLAFLDARGER